MLTFLNAGYRSIQCLRSNLQAILYGAPHLQEEVGVYDSYEHDFWWLGSQSLSLSFLEGRVSSQNVSMMPI